MKNTLKTNGKSLKLTTLGFTLIELLAVIVILAIIALIATPIVLNIISETKESAQLRSAEFYLDAVENSIALSMLKNIKITDRDYNIMSDGNICLETYDSSNDECIGVDNRINHKDDILKVEVSGEVPKKGSTITLQKGKITEIKLTYDDNIKPIVKKDGKLEYDEPYKLLYKIGEEVTFDPGDGVKTWNVIGENNNTVTLMLTQNLGDTVDWHDNSSARDNNYGPKNALEHLNSLTTGWSNVDPIASYSYTNNLDGTSKPYGYQKIEINNGVTTITHKDGTLTTLDDTNKAKARLLTKEEIVEISSKMKENLTEENLKAYIIKNLSEINTVLETSLKTVDDVIESIINSEDVPWLQNDSKKFKLYFTASIINDELEIDKEYNMALPDSMIQNLNEFTHSSYWILSSAEEGDAFDVTYYGLLCSTRVDEGEYGVGVRPVITILKSKLSK